MSELVNLGTVKKSRQKLRKLKNLLHHVALIFYVFSTYSFLRCSDSTVLGVLCRILYFMMRKMFLIDEKSSLLAG